MANVSAQQREILLGTYDFVVVGAGLSGAVIAERQAQKGSKVLVVEQREHIAGNCYDFHNEHGISVHQYGPHLFHTDNCQVWDYLSQFTQWQPYEHKVLANIDERLGPIPFNLNSLEVWFEPNEARSLSLLLVETYGEDCEVSILKLRQAKDARLRKLAEFVYQKLFLNYTVKQWGVSPEKISSEVIARVPVRISRDNRYFKDRFQAVPTEGYTAMVGNMLKHPNISIVLGVDALPLISLNKEKKKISWCDTRFDGALVYTGMLDALFHYQFGELAYRSLQFEIETLEQEQFQPATTVNYPNAPEITRITEFKHILGEHSDYTTIVKEFPQDYVKNDPARNIPYYPMLNHENQARYQKYYSLVAKYENLYPVGRLAEYRYYDMDDAVANALEVVSKFGTGSLA